MNFKKSLIIALLSLGVVNTSAAGAMEDIDPDLAEGLNYYEKGDYAKALPLLKERAEDEEYIYDDYTALAQAYLGLMYEDGKGVKQDLKTALYWYQKAAAKNDEEALYRLGNMYFEGKGVKKDVGKAKKYFQRACDRVGHDHEKYCGVLKGLTK